MGRRTDIDWEAIERDYRATQLSVPELARKYGVNARYVYAHAKGDPEKGIPPWERDLTPAVKLATKRKLIEEIIKESASQSVKQDESKVEAVANVNAYVIKRHRGALEKVRSVVEGLLEELKSSTSGLDEEARARAVEAMRAEGLDDQKANAILGALTMKSRLDAIKELSVALSKLIPLERNAYGIDDKPEQENSFEAWAREQGLLQ